MTDIQLQEAKDLVRRKLQQQLGASILSPVAPSQLDDDLKRARINALNRSGKKDDDEDQEYVPLISRTNTTLTEDGSKFLTTMTTIEELPENPFTKINRQKSKDTILAVFDDNPAFQNLTPADVQVDFADDVIEEKIEIGKDGKPIKTLGKTLKENSMILFIPKIMTEPIIIPPSQDQQTLQDVLDEIDKLNKINLDNPKEAKKITPSVLKERFNSVEEFNLYNPVTETISAGDSIFKTN